MMTSKILRSYFETGDRWEYGVYVRSTDTLHLYPTRNLRTQAARNLREAGVSFTFTRRSPRGTTTDIEVQS